MPHLPGCYHHVILFAFAQQQVFAKQERLLFDDALDIAFADVVEVNAAAFDVLPRLAFALAQTAVHQRLH